METNACLTAYIYLVLLFAVTIQISNYITKAGSPPGASLIVSRDDVPNIMNVLVDLKKILADEIRNMSISSQSIREDLHVGQEV